jgi:hypothetical protein
VTTTATRLGAPMAGPPAEAEIRRDRVDLVCAAIEAHGGAVATGLLWLMPTIAMVIGLVRM